jgi:hypothetical protein
MHHDVQMQPLRKRNISGGKVLFVTNVLVARRRRELSVRVPLLAAEVGRRQTRSALLASPRFETINGEQCCFVSPRRLADCKQWHTVW